MKKYVFEGDIHGPSWLYTSDGQLIGFQEELVMSEEEAQAFHSYYFNEDPAQQKQRAEELSKEFKMWKALMNAKRISG